MASVPSAGPMSEVPLFTRQHQEWMATDPEYLAEDMALNLAETISRIMELRAISKSELARRMGVSRSYVTRLLQAPPNMTLKTLATVGLALGVVPRIDFPDMHKEL